MTKIKHYLRIGSAIEQKLLLDNDELKKHLKENGIVFNANIVAHSPAALYRFLYINFPKIKYFIDPQTYIFQLDPIKYYSSKLEPKKPIDLKRSVRTLVEQYGSPVKAIESTRKPVEHGDLKKNLVALSEKVIKFQKEYLYNKYVLAKKDDGYEDYEDNKKTKNILPEYLIPPYFYLAADDNEKWHELNIEAIKIVEKMESPDTIAAELVMEKQILLNDGMVKKICDEYGACKAGTILLWIDDYDETGVSLAYLNKYIKLLEGLKAKQKKVINMYGGAYSLLLSRKGDLSGFCHGPGYGECRGIKPVGGGIPTAKYYLPQLYKRVQFETAFTLMRELKISNDNYLKDVCACSKCKEIIKLQRSFEDNYFEYGKYELAKSGSGREVPTHSTLTNNQIHYLLRRYDDLDNLELDHFAQKAKDFAKWNKSYHSVSTRHLSDWIQSLGL